MEMKIGFKIKKIFYLLFAYTLFSIAMILYMQLQDIGIFVELTIKEKAWHDARRDRLNNVYVILDNQEEKKLEEIGVSPMTILHLQELSHEDIIDKLFDYFKIINYNKMKKLYIEYYNKEIQILVKED